MTHRSPPHFRSSVQGLVLAVLLLLAPAIAGAQPQRPSALDILPGFLRLEAISYAPGADPDPTKPAAGTARLVLTIASVSVNYEAVPLRDVVLDAQNRLQSIVIAPAQDIILDNIAGCRLEIPHADLVFRAADGLQFNVPATITLPLRRADGSLMKLRAAALKYAAAAQEKVLLLERVAIDGVSGPVEIALPGLSLSTPEANIRIAWSTVAPAVELRAASATAKMGLPGLASTPELPLEANITNLLLTTRGEATFDKADLKSGITISPLQCAGFELKVKGGRIGMSGGIPAFEAIRFDLLFPQHIKNAAGTGRATILDVNVDVASGLIIEINQSFSARVGDIKIDCTQIVLDLSTTAATANPAAPASIRTRKTWTGAWLKSGTLKVPLAGKDLPIGITGLLIEPQGLTGEARTQSALPSVDVAGYAMTPQLIEVNFLRNQLTRGRIAGKLRVGPAQGTLGDLDADVDFTLSGDFAMTLASEQGLNLGNSLGLTLTRVKGRLSTSDKLLVLSGTLGLRDPALTVQVSNFRVDANGKLYIPQEGLLTLDEPAVVDIGVIQAEARRVGFTCAADGRTLTSVSFTGAARLKSPMEGLSFGSEIDLEHLTIRPGEPGKPPTIELGGLGVTVEIPELGTIGASLALSDELEGFMGTQVLYGDAQFSLKPLGNVGLDVCFLMAPQELAWFVGGDVMLPSGIKVMIPATPTSPPVPLFEIKGFLGGFGFNVAPLNASGGGIGPIKEPEKELALSRGTVLAQAGLLLADYYAGDRAWWADAVMTCTFNPLMLDLTARLALLDLEGVSRFPSNDEWRQRDRIARAYINLDLGSSPALALGGDFDLNFPSRKFALVEASGEGRFKVSQDEAYVRLGYWWAPNERDRQRPLRISVARALDDYVELRGQMGMVLDLKDKAGEMRLDARAEFKQVPLGASVNGRLAVTGVGTERLIATGNLDVRGRADFEIFEAEARGVVSAQYNTNQFRNKLHLAGTLKGSFGPLASEIQIAETFQ
jgi:hypothetical protein